jgi:uncharacterized protein (DUF1330 family)
MSAYLLAEIEVLDAETYEGYMRLVPPTVAAFGGRYLARGGAVRALEGDWRPGRLALLEFPSVEQALAWWSSSEYEPLKALRQESTRTRMIVVEGFEGPPQG